MILIDVYVPSVSEHYAFRVEEKVKISLVIDEMAELICQKEHCHFSGDRNELLLCLYKDNAIMNRENTLYDYGVTDGDRVILV